MASDPGLHRSLVRGWVLAAVLSAMPAVEAAAQPVDLLATPTSATLPQPGAVDFEIGRVEYVGTVELIVAPKNTSKTWFLFVHTDDLDLGGWGKPVEDLLWRVQGSGTWSSLDPASRLVESGIGSRSVFLDIAVALRWDEDLPATYLADLLFEAGHDALP